MTGQHILIGYSDVPFEVLNNDFIRDGYEFIGWNTQPNGSGTMILPNLFIDVQKDMKLYAQWKLVYVYMYLVREGNVNVTSNTSTFGANSCLRTPSYFNLTNTSSFELVLKFTTGADINTSQVLFRQTDSYEYGLYIQNGKLVYNATNTQSGITLSANTTYYMKVVKNCTTLDIYLSTDGNAYNKVMSLSKNFNVNNLYFAFGYNKKYTVQEPYYVDRQVLKYRNPAYTTYEDRWITNELRCAYGDRNGRTYTYALKLQHATRNKYKSNGTANSNSCGYWYINYPIYHAASGAYYETVTDTLYKAVEHEHCNFKGMMDFNESYFMLDGLKYKLRA